MVRISKQRLTSVVAWFLVASLMGCSNSQQSRDSLDRFAKSYPGFRKAVDDTEVISWVIALDQRERNDEVNKTPYRRSFADAFDFKASDLDRVEAARGALGYYDSQSTKMMGDFDSRIGAVDQTSLLLVETASAIGNASYRPQAVAVADSSRKVRQTLSALRDNFAATYRWQLELLEAVVKEGGVLNRISSLMQQRLLDKDRLDAENDQLRKDEQESIGRLKEQYAVFKGVTGVALDYSEQGPEAGKSPQ